jgi:hypothetical protein
MDAYVKVNGSMVASTQTFGYDRGASYGRYSNNKVETTLYLTANDTVEIENYAYNEDGSVTIESAMCEFIVRSMTVASSSTNADTVDGLHGSQFVRSDVASSTSGPFDVGGTTKLQINQSGNVNQLISSTGSFSATPLAFLIAGSEKARFDESGNLLVGTTDNTVATQASGEGFYYNAGFNMGVARSGGTVAQFNRQTNDGDIIDFRKDGTTVGSIGSYLGAYSYIGSTGGIDTHIAFVNGSVRPATETGATLDATLDLGNSSARWNDLHLSGQVYVASGNIGGSGGPGYDVYISSGTGTNGNGLRCTNYISTNAALPCRGDGASTDNVMDLGTSGTRFDDVYATNGTIQTSDRNEKQDIEKLSDAETRVAVACKGLLRKFRWKDSVAEKGNEARTHFGIIAQDLQDAFNAEGLNASDYAMFISTTWIDEETSEEKTRMGVRYSELLAFIIAAL